MLLTEKKLPYLSERKMHQDLAAARLAAGQVILEILKKRFGIQDPRKVYWDNNPFAWRAELAIKIKDIEVALDGIDDSCKRGFGDLQLEALDQTETLIREAYEFSLT